MAIPIKDLTSKKEFDEFTAKAGLNLVHFSASWADACAQLDEILFELGKELPDTFDIAKVDAEGVAEASLENGVTAVPTIAFFKDGKPVDKLNGFHPIELKNLIVKHSITLGPAAGSVPPIVGQAHVAEKESLNDRLKMLINKTRMTIFMKGSADQPKCGFSRQIVDMLRQHNAAFWTFDILSDEEVRQGLKTYSDWPTYPQLYLDGELLGGLDVIREELNDPEFVAKLPKAE